MSKNKPLNKQNSSITAEKLGITYDIAKLQLQNEINRAEKLDSKFNILLVFLAALIAALNLIFPYSNLSEYRKIICNVFIVEFIICAVSTGILILFSMFPKYHSAIDEKIFTDQTFQSKEQLNLYGSYIKGIQLTIQGYYKTNERKGKLMKAAFILAMISFVFFCILLIIKFI